jgi:signal peptidase I
MLPTLPEEDMLLIDKLSQRALRRPFRRGDVVIAWAVYDNRRSVCKRVAALEGDVVMRYKADDGVGVAAGVQAASTASSPAAAAAAAASSAPAPVPVPVRVLEAYTVPAGHVWLLGDNSGRSTDSRDYGAGKALVCVHVCAYV